MPGTPLDAYRQRARLLSSSAPHYSSARPGAEQSVHAAPPHGLMPPVQIHSGSDSRSRDPLSRDLRLTNCDPWDRDAPDTPMRNGGTPHKRDVSQNRLPAVPTVERDERPKTPPRMTYPSSMSMRTPERPRADSSKSRSSPYSRASPSHPRRTPAEVCFHKSVRNITPIRVADIRTPPKPLKRDPDVDMPMSSLTPKRTLMPLHANDREHDLEYMKWFRQQTFVPMFHLPGPGGKYKSDSAFQLGDRGLPLDKSALHRMRYRDVGLDVPTAEIVIVILWPGYAHNVRSLQRTLRTDHGALSETVIANTVSDMVESLQKRVYQCDAKIDPKFDAFDLNKVTVHNFRITNLSYYTQNFYQPMLCLC